MSEPKTAEQQKTIDDHLTGLRGKVLIGKGPYQTGQKVSWPLPHPSDLVGITARVKHEGLLIPVEAESVFDPVPQKVSSYLVFDYGCSPDARQDPAVIRFQ